MKLFKFFKPYCHIDVVVEDGKVKVPGWEIQVFKTNENFPWVLKISKLSNSTKIIKISRRAEINDKVEHEYHIYKKIEQKMNDEIKLHFSKTSEFMYTTTNGIKYFTMNYIDNISIQEYVEGQEVTLDLLIDLIKEIYNVVKELHKIHIAHNDLHGGNVLIEKATDRVVIIDFGEAINTENQLEEKRLDKFNLIYDALTKDEQLVTNDKKLKINHVDYMMIFYLIIGKQWHKRRSWNPLPINITYSSEISDIVRKYIINANRNGGDLDEAFEDAINNVSKPSKSSDSSDSSGLFD
jgi:serine/threonine protein kinase